VYKIKIGHYLFFENPHIMENSINLVYVHYGYLRVNLRRQFTSAILPRKIIFDINKLSKY
jgi:hypothetical protein